MDLISEKLTESVYLMDVNYSVVGTAEKSILLKVSGDVSIILENDTKDIMVVNLLLL